LLCAYIVRHDDHRVPELVQEVLQESDRLGNFTAQQRAATNANKG
jgi:hypothetical protein